MPAVTPNDNDLVARLAAMERRIATLEGRRRADRPAVGLFNGGAQSFTAASGKETVVWGSTVYDTGGIGDVVGDKILVPSSGYYLHVINLPQGTVSAAADLTVDYGVFSSKLWRVSTAFDISVSGIFGHTAGDELVLKLDVGTNTSITGAWWAVHYLRPLR